MLRTNSATPDVVLFVLLNEEMVQTEGEQPGPEVVGGYPGYAIWEYIARSDAL